MKKKIILLICILLVLAFLGGAAYYGYTQHQAKLAEEARQAEIAAFYATPDVKLVVTEEDISQLELYTNLKNVDLSGSTCYDAIVSFMNAHPGVNVTYTVELGGTTVAHDVTELELAAGSFDYATLAENLQYLPQVTGISLPVTDLSREQIDSLRAAYPGIAVDYTVTLLGQELTEDVTTLDVSTMEAGQIGEIAAVLPMLPNVHTLDLLGETGTNNMSTTDVKALMDACMGMKVVYEFDFYGLRLSTATETVELNKVNIGNEGEETIRQALDIMPHCTYMKLDDCGIDSAVMASIRADYPDTKVVWRIFFGKFNCLTDAEMLRLTNGLKDQHVGELIYCNDVKYLDVGHNEPLTDISFIAYMPKLEICILSGSSVSDLTAFTNHQNIEFLEMCFCSNVKDLSPLVNCPNLKFLNISYTAVRDLELVYDMPLERFNCMQNKIPDDQQAKFLEGHPNCLTRFSGTQCYGYGWRYDDDGITFSEYYANMRVIFMYDDAGYVSGKEYTR